MNPAKHNVFITGATGYMGGVLIPELLRRGHAVRGLVRPGSEAKLAPGCEPVFGDALKAGSYQDRIQPSDSFIHLVGVAHPSPAKAAQFRSVDLVSALEAIRAAALVGMRHFIYLSVAHPAPMMKTYIEVRSECEASIHQTGMNATILRPWYVLGPGHRWPYALLPFYWLMEQIPATREGALRLGLVTLDQMKWALVNAVENPADGVRVVNVPDIRQAAPAA